MKQPQKILIIQLRRVGDVIFTLPVIGALRKNFPHAQIDFLVEKPSDQMVRLNPHLNETLVYEKTQPLQWIKKIREKNYDWVLDFHSNGRTLVLSLLSGAKVKAGFKGPITRSWVYTHLSHMDDQKYLVDQKMDILKDLGVDVDQWNWDLVIPSNISKWAENFLSQSGIDPQSNNIIGIAPATRRPIRAWKSENFRQVAQKISKAGQPVLFLWGPGEKELIHEITIGLKKHSPEAKIIIPPETTLLELAGLIKKCSCVLALDNGPKNMAVALDVPTFTLSGPTNPKSFNPHDDPRHVLIRENNLLCISCGLNQCPYNHECMENISAETVYEKMEKFIQSKSTNLLQTS